MLNSYWAILSLYTNRLHTPNCPKSKTLISMTALRPHSMTPFPHEYPRRHVRHARFPREEKLVPWNAANTTTAYVVSRYHSVRHAVKTAKNRFCGLVSSCKLYLGGYKTNYKAPQSDISPIKPGRPNEGLFWVMACGLILRRNHLCMSNFVSICVEFLELWHT